MAEAAELLIPPLEAEDEIGEADPETLDEIEEISPCNWPVSSPSASDRRRIDLRHHHGGTGAAAPDPDVPLPAFSPTSDARSFARRNRHITLSDSESESDYLDDQVTLALDLSDRRSPQPPHHHGGVGGDGPEMDPFPETLDPFGFGVYDGGVEMGSDYLELGLGLGLGSGRESRRESRRDDENAGVAGEDLEVEGSDWAGDGLFWGRSADSESVSSLGETSSSHCSSYGEGLRIVGFDWDSDSEDERIHAGIPVSNVSDPEDRITDDLGLRVRWDCLHIEDDRGDLNEEFEWEEVDGRVDEREVLNMVIDAEGGDQSIGQEEAHVDVELEEGVISDTEEDLMRVFEDAEEQLRRDAMEVDWEFLMAVNNFNRTIPTEHDHDSYLGVDREDYVYTSEYEILFGQFADHDSSIRGTPPAAKSVVECLPSVVLTQDDVANKNTLCAVCKDDISLDEESAKRLPCLHHYHGECILPWLRIRNTCPVCRYELPTDDPDYESWKAGRAGNGGGAAQV